MSADVWPESNEDEKPKKRRRKPGEPKPPRVPLVPRVRKDGQPDKRFLKYSEGKKGGCPPGRKVAPGLQPRKKGERVKSADDRRQPVHLSPIQLRALDAYFDPKHHTLEDVARGAGIHGRTLRGWLATHPKFVEEWRARSRFFVEGFADHTIRSAIAAMDVLVSLARDEKQPASVRLDAAKEILRATHGLKVQVDVLATHQHAHVVAQVPSPASSSSTSAPVAPASVRRLSGPAEPSAKDWSAEMRELSVAVEQLSVGALTTVDALNGMDQEHGRAATQGVIDGEATPR